MWETRHHPQVEQEEPDSYFMVLWLFSAFVCVRACVWQKEKSELLWFYDSRGEDPLQTADGQMFSPAREESARARESCTDLQKHLVCYCHSEHFWRWTMPRIILEALIKMYVV